MTTALRGLALLVALSFAACSGSPAAFKKGGEAAKRQRWDEAVQYYERALREEPDNVEYRIALTQARAAAARAHLRQARENEENLDWARAISELELAIRYDPTHPYVQEELEQARHRSLAGDSVEPRARPREVPPIRLKFENASLRGVLETLAVIAGVNILFDESFRDKQVTIDLRGVSFRQALDLVTGMNGLFYEVSPSSTIVVSSPRLSKQ